MVEVQLISTVKWYGKRKTVYDTVYAQSNFNKKTSPI